MNDNTWIAIGSLSALLSSGIAVFIWASDKLFSRLDHIDKCLDDVKEDTAYIKGKLGIPE